MKEMIDALNSMAMAETEDLRDSSFNTLSDEALSSVANLRDLIRALGAAENGRPQ